MKSTGKISPLVFRLATLVAALGALAWLWAAWCQFPAYAWNDVRLAPAFALRHGINPYPPVGGGPLSTWIYGPVGILVNLPATFAPSAPAAIHLAAAINALVLLGPLALIFFGSAELRRPGWLAAGFALALGALLLRRSHLVLQVADHTAIACGLLSGWCLARAPTLSARRLAGVAALGALAAWSKQIAVFLVLAHLIHIVRFGGRGAALRYLGWTIAWHLAALGIFSAAFGFSNLWLNLVAIPGRLPWAGDVTSRLLLRPWTLGLEILAPLTGLLALGLIRAWPAPGTESGRFLRFAVAAYLVMLPVGFIGFFKIGGDINLLHSWSYLMPAVLLAWLSRDGDTPAAGLRWWAAAALGLGLHAREFATLPARPLTEHFAVAAELTARFPHAIWFPQNPVLTFYADGRLWHSEDGMITRHYAGYGIREADFRRHLPPDLQALAYPATGDNPITRSLLGELSVKVDVPYWTLHVRPPAAP